MVNKIFVFVTLPCLLALSGCMSRSEMKLLGCVNGTKVYVIHAAYPDGPNVTAFAFSNGKDFHVDANFSSPGFDATFNPLIGSTVVAGLEYSRVPPKSSGASITVNNDGLKK